MTIILFVHGTGVRMHGYEENLARIKKGFGTDRFSDFGDLRVEGCLWGEQYGSRRAEKSIFKYAETGGSEYTDEDAREDTWRLLSADPMAGLRFLTLNREPYPGGIPGVIPPAQQLENAVDGLHRDHWEDLGPILDEAQITEVFREACERLKTAEAFKALKKVASLPLDPYLDALAEALVALAIAIDAEKDRTPIVELNDDIRVRTTDVIRKNLGGVSAGIIDKLAKTIGQTITRPLTYAGSLALYATNATVGTPVLNSHRGSFLEGASPIAGDILLYQCRGNSIRDVIKARIEEMDGPVVLLAHSLGGVACVDLLLDPECAGLSDRVKLLITVGSQAPYFYEIGALHSIPLDKQAGRMESAQAGRIRSAFAHFPPWLNLHNRRDFLSYIGHGVFPGRVTDREINSRIPFPQSHSAYFALDATYAEIHAELGKALR